MGLADVQLLAVLEIAYQFAVHNEREAEKMPLSPTDYTTAYLFYGNKYDHEIRDGLCRTFTQLDQWDQRYWFKRATDGTANETPGSEPSPAGGTK